MKPVVLCVLDGWGYSQQKLGNAILNANTPNINTIASQYPSILLQASGQTVGLEWGEPGNSEVGHLTLGSGRIIFQYLSRINKAIDSGDFFKNEALLKALDHSKSNGSSLHLVGLLTSSSVHAHLSHIFALLDMAKKNNVENVYLHLFTDGKDSGQKEAPELLKKVESYIAQIGLGRIATIIGRDIAMDRNNNWDLTKQFYDLITKGEGQKTDNAQSQLSNYYKSGLTDILIPPTILDNTGLVQDGDSIIFFNFREDRMKQVIQIFADSNFDKFEKVKMPNLMVVCMTEYLEDYPLNVAFPPPVVKNCLAEVLSSNDLKQLHLAETEKYAHVTFFFNGLVKQPFNDEDDVLIKSEREATADPAMKSREIASRALEEIHSEKYDFILINFANPDMLAHMGDFEHTIKGIEILDEVIGQIKDAVLAKDGALIITSDHGNAEAMTYKSTGNKATRHDTNPVPLYLVAKKYESSPSVLGQDAEIKGFLYDVAPTILEILGIKKPEEMIGDSLLAQLGQ